MKRKSKIMFFVISGSSVYILLGRRKVSNFNDFWWLPGGSAEPGETDLQAALREIEEELVLSRIIEECVQFIKLQNIKPPYLKYLTLTAQYTVYFIKLSLEALQTVPSVRAEFEQFQWFVLESLPQNMSREWSYLQKNVTKEFLQNI